MPTHCTADVDGLQRTREELNAIMDAVFEMYLAKDLEVVVRRA